MKIEFNVKYGKNVIEIPITENTRPSFDTDGMTNLWKRKITVYNDIPSTATEERHFDRFVIDLCNIQGGIVSRADGTIENIVNAVTVITKDVGRYKSPLEYRHIPVDLREQYFTMQIGDFIVLDEVDDIVTTSREFANLQTKYKDNGIIVRSISANISGMAVDNVTVTNVG